jgi:hypothetical protein
VEEKIQKPELMMAIKASPDAGLAGCWAVLFLCALFWLWLAVQQQESTLTIHPVSQGVSMPDGFSVWHHLDANGIRFKSITPQKDGLLIKFDSSAQGSPRKKCWAAPCRMVILLLCWRKNTPTAWLSRLRDAPHRLG